MRNYLLHHLPDWLLCGVAALCLVQTVCSGFELVDGFYSGAIPVLAISLGLGLLFQLLSYHRWATGLGIAAGVLLFLEAMVLCRAVNPLQNEQESSLLIFWLTELVTALLVFLLSRSRAGSIGLFLLGNLLGAGAHFLQFPAPGWAYVLFLPACGGLYLYRSCGAAVRRAVLGKIQAGRYVVQLVSLALAALLLAGAGYWALIRPLDPPTQELRLIQRLRSMELLQVLGVSSVKTVLDPSLSSNAPPDRTEFGNPPPEAPPEPELPEVPPPPAPLKSPEPAETTAPVNYPAETHLSRLWLLCLIPAAIALAFGLRAWRWRHFRTWLGALPHGEALLRGYPILLKRLGRAGLARSATQTLTEFTAESATALEAFPGFPEATALYQRVLYGASVVTDGEYQQFDLLLAAFRRDLRRELGPVKYYLQAFRF